MGKSEPLACRRCGKPVEVYRDDYDLFEGMHWLCFHLEFEHEGDPDAPCADPGCPRWHVQVFRRKLSQLGVDPDEVLSEAIQNRLPGRDFGPFRNLPPEDAR